jgi:transcription-repair coupling factor (superfamily II helicase)
MTEEARKRMQALEQFSDLGSGLNIAMKDLEIRGAGDLLGGEQSGFINEIGFETYQKILTEAIDELKENEFKSLYETSEDTNKDYIRETTFDTDLELLIPTDYVNNTTERLNLYTRLNELKTEEELQLFASEMEDRFGPLPHETQNLLTSIRLKWLAINLGFERIVIKNNRMIGYFIADQESSFYQSKTFGRVLEYIKTAPKQIKMNQKQTRNGLRLLMTFENINSVDKALKHLSEI